MRLQRPSDANLAAVLRGAELSQQSIRFDLDPLDGDAPGATAAEIHQAIVLGDAHARDRVLRAASVYPHIALAFRRMARRRPLAVSTVQRAADSGRPGARHVGPYTVEVRRSEAQPDRAYLIVKFPPTIPPPWLLMEGDEDSGPMIRLPLPEDGAIQVIVRADDVLVTAIENPLSILTLI